MRNVCGSTRLTCTATRGCYLIAVLTGGYNNALMLTLIITFYKGMVIVVSLDLAIKVIQLERLH